MKKRNLWRALMAALLCVALLCPTLALAEDEGLEISAISGDDLGLDVATGDGLDLDVNETFDGALPNLPGLDLGSDLVLDDILVPDETGPIALGGEAVSNEGGDAGESGETPAPEDVVTLVASYTGDPLTKVYDCNKYGAYKKQKEDGTYEIVYCIEALKTIKNLFTLTPVKGKSLVEGHDNVQFKLTLSKQYDAADVGKYKFEFTLELTGDDAPWYTIKNPVVKVTATITRREVTVSPRANLEKAYGSDDPVYPAGTKFTLKYTSGDVAVSQDVGGVVTYGVPTFTADQMTAVKYLIAEAKLKERDFFPGFLGRKKGENAGKYRVTRGTLDFGSNFKLKVAEGYFTINRRDVNDSAVTVNAIKDKTYTGKAIKPTPVVRLNGKKLKLGTAYTLKYSNYKSLGNASVTIVGKGNFTGKRKLTYRIVLKPTAISKLASSASRIAVTWKKGQLNTGYEVSYGTSADFFDAQTQTVKGINNTKLTLKNLLSKTTYYIRVRTYKNVKGNAYYSSWSKAKKITTK